MDKNLSPTLHSTFNRQVKQRRFELRLVLKGHPTGLKQECNALVCSPNQCGYTTLTGIVD